MPQVKVSLNITASPPVTLNPNNCPVNPGNDTIRWVEDPQSPTKGFTFSSLTGLPDPPFDNLTKTATEISVDDDNTAAAEYPYTIAVSYNNTLYSSAGAKIGGNPGDPTVNNK